MTALLLSQCHCQARFVDVPAELVMAGETIGCGAPWCHPGVVTFTFHPPAPLMNMNVQKHWAVKMTEVKAWRTAAFVAVRKARITPQARSIVGLSLPVRSLKVRRDPSNFAPTTKACVDGCVDAGIWPDDTGDYVVTSEPSFRTGETVIVWIEPLPDHRDEAA